MSAAEQMLEAARLIEHDANGTGTNWELFVVAWLKLEAVKPDPDPLAAGLAVTYLEGAR